MAKREHATSKASPSAAVLLTAFLLIISCNLAHGYHSNDRAAGPLMLPKGRPSANSSPANYPWNRDGVEPCSPTSPCADGSCCGSNNTCGYGPDYCGHGCSSQCNATAMCGRYSDGGLQKCGMNTCCSYYGWCGTEETHCGNPDPNGLSPCQQGFGSCEVVPAPSCAASAQSTAGRTIAYYQASNVYKRVCNKISPSQINTTGLTHLYYAFVQFDPTTFDITSANNGSDTATWKDFTSLKTSTLQTWVAIGGFDFSDTGTSTHEAWSDMVSTSANRAVFINCLKSFLADNGFQGADLDWEYPVAEDRGGSHEDTQNFVALIREMRASFGTQLGISVTLAPDFWYLRWFDAKAMEPYVDWFGFMAYNLHGSWDADVKALGSLVRGQTDIRDIAQDAEPLWFDHLDMSKINFGLAYYGRGYTLANRNCTTLECPFLGPSRPGRCTNFEGVMSLREIQSTIAEQSIQPTLLESSMMKQIAWDDQWIGYDDEETLSTKRSWADAKCFGGTMIWSIDFSSGPGSGDDPPNSTNGTCTSANCGNGCQSGNCTGGGLTNNGRCGSGFNNSICGNWANGSCCSAAGYCGSTPEHCGDGCQSGCGGDDHNTPSNVPILPLPGCTTVAPGATFTLDASCISAITNLPSSGALAGLNNQPPGPTNCTEICDIWRLLTGTCCGKGGSVGNPIYIPPNVTLPYDLPLATGYTPSVNLSIPIAGAYDPEIVFGTKTATTSALPTSTTNSTAAVTGVATGYPGDPGCLRHECGCLPSGLPVESYPEGVPLFGQVTIPGGSCLPEGGIDGSSDPPCDGCSPGGLIIAGGFSLPDDPPCPPGVAKCSPCQYGTCPDGHSNNGEDDDQCDSGLDPEIGRCGNGNFPLYDPTSNTIRCDIADDEVPLYMSPCQEFADDNLEYSIDLIECEVESCPVNTKRSTLPLGRYGIASEAFNISRRASGSSKKGKCNKPPPTPSTEQPGDLHPGRQGECEVVFHCDTDRWPNVCNNAASAQALRAKPTALTYQGPNARQSYVTQQWWRTHAKKGNLIERDPSVRNRRDSGQLAVGSGWGLIGCEVEEYPFGNSVEPIPLADRGIFSNRAVLRLVPGDENSDHGQALARFVGLAKKGDSDQNIGPLDPNGGWKYCVDVTGSNIDKSYYLLSPDQRFNRCGKAYGPGFLLMNDVSPAEARAYPAEPRWDPWFDQHAQLFEHTVYSSGASIATEMLPSQYGFYPAPGVKTWIAESGNNDKGSWTTVATIGGSAVTVGTPNAAGVPGETGENLKWDTPPPLTTHQGIWRRTIDIDDLGYDPRATVTPQITPPPTTERASFITRAGPATSSAIMPAQEAIPSDTWTQSYGTPTRMEARDVRLAQRAALDGSFLDVNVYEGALNCEAPWIDPCLEGTCFDGGTVYNANGGVAANGSADQSGPDGEDSDNGADDTSQSTTPSSTTSPSTTPSSTTPSSTTPSSTTTSATSTQSVETLNPSDCSVNVEGCGEAANNDPDRPPVCTPSSGDVLDVCQPYCQKTIGNAPDVLEYGLSSTCLGYTDPGSGQALGLCTCGNAHLIDDILVAIGEVVCVVIDEVLAITETTLQALGNLPDAQALKWAGYVFKIGANIVARGSKIGECANAACPGHQFTIIDPKDIEAGLGALDQCGS